MYNNQSDSKRLAKNTFLMYARMFILLIVTLYTSRVVLRILGVEDYGIYNVVGSLVALFGSLRGLFSVSTQRFLSYEMGLGNNERLSVIFNMSIVINIALSLLFVIVSEIVGYFFFREGLNIDSSRFFAAQIVFQLSLISAVASIITTSFDAVIISHERMSFFAYVAIFDCVLRLLLVFFLSVINYDKLILYGVLQTGVTILVLIINMIYCRRQFDECFFARKWDKNYFKKMTQFAGWCFLGNTSYAVTQNGINMVLNVFGGPVVNTARGIAYQIKSTMDNLVNNIVLVIKPYSIKKYAEGNSRMLCFSLIFSGKIIYTIQILITIPLFAYTKEVLQLWLGSVPDYSISFVQLILIHCVVRSYHQTIDTIYMAMGDLKQYQICEGLVLSMPVFFSYVFLHIGMNYNVVFVLLILFEIINFFLITLFLKGKIDFPIKEFLCRCYIPSLVPLFFLYYSFDLFTVSDTPIPRILLIMINFTAIMFFTCCFIFNRSEIGLVKSFVKHRYRKE